jgi:hypothetical protein
MGEARSESARGEGQEEGRTTDAGVSGPHVCADGADEVEHQTGRCCRPEDRHGEAGQQSDRPGGQDHPEWQHPGLRSATILTESAPAMLNEAAYPIASAVRTVMTR